MLDMLDGWPLQRVAGKNMKKGTAIAGRKVLGDSRLVRWMAFLEAVPKQIDTGVC